MSQQTISTNQAPEVEIEQVAGELQVKGWDNSEISVKGDPSEVKLSEEEDIFRISSRGNCVVRLPYGSTVHVGTVRGNCQVKLLEDQLTIETIHGSLALRNVAGMQIESVHGDVAAKHISGDVRMKRIAGNSTLRDIEGECHLEEVHGNLDLRDVEADILANAKGNVRLRLSSMGGQNYTIWAEGNISCRIPEDASLRIVLATKEGRIHVRLPGEKRELDAGSLETTMGDGAGLLTLTAGGNIELSTMQAGWEEDSESLSDMAGEVSGFSEEFSEQIGRQIEAQLEAQMEAINRQLNEQMSRFSSDFAASGMSQEKIDQMMQRARETSERASVRAQEKMRRAQEKLERKLEAARRRNEMKAQAADRRAQSRSRKSWNFSWGSVPQPPEAEPVNDEERLMILRMLEQKKITLEEAESLLAALEGREQ